MANQVFPTKANLMATKKSLELANTGYDLLDQKRNVLIKEMMTQLDEVKKIRGRITDTYAKAYHALELANISMGVINELVKGIPEDQGVEITYRSVMGVEIPKIIYNPSPMFEGYDFESGNSQVDYACQCFYDVKIMSVELAQVENTVYRLANAIHKTQKRANALKNISIPELQSTVKLISDALEEKEREEFSRQKVIKAQKERKAA